MGSFNNNNNYFIGAQSKNILGLLLFLAYLTNKCSGAALNLKQQIIDPSISSSDDFFYELTTWEPVPSSSTSLPEHCQNVNSFCLTKECLRATSDLMYEIDATIDLCDDFYQFACGNWAEKHPMWVNLNNENHNFIFF